MAVVRGLFLDVMDGAASREGLRMYEVQCGHYLGLLGPPDAPKRFKINVLVS